MTPQRQDVTRLLHELSGGNKQAFDELMPLVYDQLRKMASRCLMSERPGHTLRATALVHEAYLRLADAGLSLESRVQFYGVAARAMRRILVDHARAQGRRKRGSGAQKVPLDEAVVVGAEPSIDLVELDQALGRLEERDQRKTRIIELLFFGGLTTEECATALGISLATLHRDLKMAKAWLYNELTQSAASGD